jgi:uncharacterized membrane protein YdjX (TVP38/TMEM64 family)
LTRTKAAPTRTPLRSKPWAGPLAITLAGIVVLALAIVFVDPLREAAKATVHGDSQGVRDSIHGLGVGGPLIVLGLCMLHIVLFYPAEIVDAAAGLVYGFWPGLALVYTGWMLNAWIAYWIGRRLAHPALIRLLGSERFERAERAIDNGGVTLLITLRMIPIIPFSLVCYAAGAAEVPLWRYSWTTFVGYLPLTVTAVYLGSRLETLHPTDPAVLAAIALVIVLMFGLRRVSTQMRDDEPVSKKRTERV